MKNLLNRSVLLLLVFILGFTSEVFPQGGIVPPSSGALSSSDLAINRNALYTDNHPVTVPLFQVGYEMGKHDSKPEELNYVYLVIPSLKQ